MPLLRTSSEIRSRVAAGRPIRWLVPVPWPATSPSTPLPKRGDGLMDGGELARLVAGYTDDKKAQDIVELDLRGVVGYTDYFVVCTGARAPGEGSTTGSPGDEGRPRPASQPRRGAPASPVGAHGLPRRGRPRLHARHAPSTASSSGRGALARVRPNHHRSAHRLPIPRAWRRGTTGGVALDSATWCCRPSADPGQWPSVAHRFHDGLKPVY